MKSIMQFSISQEDGAYTAEGINAPIVTFGATFEELQRNLRDAIELFFDSEQPESLGFVASPSILTNFELPSLTYGSKA